MISNIPPSHFDHRPNRENLVKQRMEEDTLKTETIHIERKTFIFALKENPRGRFLRITECSNDRRNNLIIPSTGLDDFRELAEVMIKAASEK